MMTEFDEAVNLFEEYQEAFGLTSQKDMTRQCEFELKFLKLICAYRGHDIGPDQCGKPEHDLCYRCSVLASELGTNK